MKVLQLIYLICLCSLIRCHERSRQEEIIANKDALHCEHRILQYYGFEGYMTAKVPPPEEQDGAARFCNGIELTCCSRDDFLKSKNMWGKNSVKVKGYMTKIFRIIQKLVMLQSSFIEVARDMVNDSNPFCAKIDTTFFNSPVPFDEIYSYLKTAFQSMAFLQKGFYCTLCNAENHRFMNIAQDPVRFMMVMSEKSCNDLIYYFKEFIMYKVYYLDPFIKNATHMFNCHAGEEKYKFDIDYQATYPEIKTCVEHGIGCNNVCREYRFGKSSDLFMGDLAKYETLLANFEEFAKEKNQSIEFTNEELYVPEYTFDNAEFFQPDTELYQFEKIELNQGKISAYQILVYKDGIDLFGTAANSNYFLTDQETTMEKTRIFNTNVGESDSPSLMGDETGDTALKSPNDIQNEMLEENEELQEAQRREHEEKLERMNPNNVPTKEELNSVGAEINQREEARREYTEQTGQINDFNPEDNQKRFNDFGNAARIGNASAIWKLFNILSFAGLILLS